MDKTSMINIPRDCRLSPQVIFSGLARRIGMLGTLIPAFLLCAFVITGCGTVLVETQGDEGRSPPSVPEPTQPKLHATQTPPLQEAIESTTTSEASFLPSSAYGYLLVGSKAHQGLEVRDLSTGEQVHYQTIEWRNEVPVNLDPLVTNQGWVALREEYGYLNLFQIPLEEAQHSIWLLNEELFKAPGEPDAVPHEQYYAVSNRWSAPKWSPVEPVLAFAAAMNDEWVSVYTFDTRTMQITRLTPPGSHALPLGWSPDGKQIAAVIAESIDRNEYRPQELLIIDTTQGSIKVRVQIYVRYPLQVLDWSEDGQLYFVGARQDGRLVKLHRIDSSSGKGRMLYDGPFLDVAISPIDQYAIITSPTDEMKDQIVLYDLRMPEENDVQYIVLDGEVGAVEWYPSLRSFAVECLCGTRLIGVDGTVREISRDERGLPIPSPDGRWLAFGPSEAFYDTDLRIYSAGGELVLDSGMRARDVGWWEDSTGLVFAKSIGGTSLVDLQTGMVSEPWYLSGNDLQLIQIDRAPFSEIPFKPHPTPTPTPGSDASRVSPTPTTPPIPDRILASGTELTIMELQMQDEIRGWALGQARGDRFVRVLFTHDGGATWRDVTPPKDPAPSEEYLSSRAYGSYQRAVLLVYDSEKAWVTYSAPTNLAEVVIWQTMDSGLNWRPSEPVNLRKFSEYGPWVSGYLPIAISFANQQHGWLLAVTEIPGLMMSADTILLRTEDGGQHWDFILSSSIQGLEGFEFLDRNNGWMLNTSSQPEWSRILKTIDGGENWFNEPTLPVGYQADEYRPDPACMGAYQLQRLQAGGIFMVVWCVEDSLSSGEVQEEQSNLLYFSGDGGQHWSYTMLPVDQRPDISLSYDFITDEIGWLIDFESGVIFWSINGGETWEPIKKVTWEGELDFSDHLNGWAVVWERGASASDRDLSLLRTSDGGFSWEILRPKIR
jgi:photosystem II stability/assembly factor-like uncharacterized protein